jgi:hypothetical protein
VQESLINQAFLACSTPSEKSSDIQNRSNFYGSKINWLFVAVNGQAWVDAALAQQVALLRASPALLRQPWGALLHWARPLQQNGTPCSKSHCCAAGCLGGPEGDRFACSNPFFAASCATPAAAQGWRVCCGQCPASRAIAIPYRASVFIRSARLLEHVVTTTAAARCYGRGYQPAQTPL